MLIHKDDVEGLVLCGGKSTRFGSPKAHFVFEGTTLVERAINLLLPYVGKVSLAVGDSLDDDWPPADLICDHTPGLGPIGGLQAGLARLRTDWLLVLAVDLPFVTGDAIEKLLGCTRTGDLAVIARDSDNRVHPLCGLYHRSVRNEIDRNIDASELSMKALLLALQNVRYVTLPTETLRNVNRPADLS